ncbi:MAG: DUF6599 family protein [Verrucomicrobiota bacterium]
MATRRAAILLAWCLAGFALLSPPVRAAEAPDPALAALAGGKTWKLLESPKVFGPENLYEEIDGEAELFLPYGVKRLTVGVVEERSAPGVALRVELYRMASGRDAFGVYSQHRYPDQEIVSVPPSEVILSETSADFYRGETFVRLRTRPGGSSRRLVSDLVKELVALLPGDAAVPGEARVLESFPGAVHGSVIYQRRAMLGYECLAPGFEGSFSEGTLAGRLILLPPAAARVPARAARIAKELPEFGEVSGALSRATLPSGTLWLAPAGGCIVGVAARTLSRDEAVRVLETLSGRAAGVCGKGEKSTGTATDRTEARGRGTRSNLSGR